MRKIKKYKVTATFIFADNDGSLSQFGKGAQNLEHLFKANFVSSPNCQDVDVDIEEYDEQITDPRIVAKENRKGEILKEREEREKAKSDKSGSRQSN